MKVPPPQKKKNERPISKNLVPNKLVVSLSSTSFLGEISSHIEYTHHSECVKSETRQVFYDLVCGITEHIYYFVRRLLLSKNHLYIYPPRNIINSEHIIFESKCNIYLVDRKIICDMVMIFCNVYGIIFPFLHLALNKILNCPVWNTILNSS